MYILVIERLIKTQLPLLLISALNIPICIKKAVTQRVRDREPSRVLLTRVMKSLKCRKLGKKHKSLIKNSVSVSSVLHSFATHYKQWLIKYTNRQDRFYSSCSMKYEDYNIHVICQGILN